jgi:hypothetical protein
VTALPRPLPAEYVVRCPPPTPAPQTPEVDAVAVALKEMYDLYGLCAGRMVDLIDWLQTMPPRSPAARGALPPEGAGPPWDGPAAGLLQQEGRP